MTTREFYEAIANGSAITDEMKEIAQKGLAALERKNEKAKEARLAKNEADAPLVKALFDVATSEPMLTSVLASKVGVSTPKASALARKLVAEGKFVEIEVKVPKVGVRKAYKRA